jgi:hypothetical protein
MVAFVDVDVVSWAGRGLRKQDNEQRLFYYIGESACDGLNGRKKMQRYLLHQPRASQKLLSRCTVRKIKAQAFGHEVRYAFHVRRTQYILPQETMLERFADKALEFLGST